MFPNKSTIVSFCILCVGVFLHIRGHSMADPDKAMLSQFLGTLFDLTAGVVIWIRSLHAKNARAILDAFLNIGQEPPDSVKNSAKSLVLFLGLSALLAGTPGCALFNPGAHATAQDKLTAAEGVFNVTLEVLVTARSAGKISDADYNTINGIIKSINAGFDQVHADLAAGKTLDQSEAWTVIQTATQQLLVYKWRYGNGNSSVSFRGPRLDPDYREAFRQWRADVRRGPGASLRAA